jgi:hypothetical protein
VIEADAKVLRHARYLMFQMAALNGLFAAILERIRSLVCRRQWFSGVEGLAG